MKKIISIGVILLFIGLSISSSNGRLFEEQSSSKTEFNDDLTPHIYGLKGKRGWSTSPVVISFTYNPIIISKIWYSITEDIEPDWQLYDEPFTFGEEGSFWFQFKYLLNETGNETIWPDKIPIKIDLSLPEVEITKPEIGRFYLFGLRLFRIEREIPLMIGKSTLMADAQDNVSGVYNVSFLLSIENVIKTIYIDKKAPYLLRLKGKFKGTYNLIVEVEDVAGHLKNVTHDVEIIQYGIL